MKKKNNYPKKFVNYIQSKEERKWKYKIARIMGANSSLAQMLRDYSISKHQKMMEHLANM